MPIFITLFPIFGTFIFFTAYGLIGLTYERSSASYAFVIFNMLVFTMTIIYLIGYFIKKPKISKSHLIPLLAPLVFIFIFMFNLLLFGYPSDLEINFFIFFMLWSFPAFYIGYIVSKIGQEKLVRWIELLSIFFALSLFRSIFIVLLANVRPSGIGGTTLQTTSYLSAFTFGLLLYFYFFGDNHERFRFTKKTFYKPLQLVLIMISFLSTIVSGGRGAFLLLLLYSLYFVASNLKMFKFWKLMPFFFVIILVVIFINTTNYGDIVSIGFRRATQFISDDFRVDWQGTSGRDLVFSSAIELIEKSPLIGHGLFRYLRLFPNPHNLILEVLLAGGLVYFSLFTLHFVYITRKIIFMVNIDTKNRLWLVILFLPLTMLMFSGSYLVSPELWFTFSLVLFTKVL